MKNTLNKMFSRIVVIMLMLFSVSVFASELTQPKKDGIIGEKFDGYIGLVRSASPEIKALVTETNQKRKEKYQEVAIAKQLPLNKVELIAGESNINKTLVGDYIMLTEGQWQKK